MEKPKMKHTIASIKKAMLEDADLAIAEVQGLEKELREIQNKEAPKLRHLTVVYITEILGE